MIIDFVLHPQVLNSNPFFFVVLVIAIGSAIGIAVVKIKRKVLREPQSDHKGSDILNSRLM